MMAHTLTLDDAKFLEEFEAAAQIYRPCLAYEPGNPKRFPNLEDRYQLQFHRSRHIVRMLVLGNGAGKTTTAAVEADWWLQGTHPYQRDFVSRPPVRVWWVCQKFQQWEELQEQIERRCFTAGWQWNDNKHRYSWPNGSKFTVFSGDGSWEGMQGPNPDLVIIDEECEAAMWRELSMRRRGDKKTRYIIPATATKGKRWMFHDIYTPWLKHHVDKGLSEAEAMREQSHPDYWVWPRGGLLDNPANDEGDVRWYDATLANASPQERQARLRGGFVDLNQSPVFDLDALDAVEQMIKQANRPGVQGTLLPVPDVRGNDVRPTRFEFVPNGGLHEGGRITIYEAPGQYSYVVGADFAHGLSTGDFDAAVVLRRAEDGSVVQVAECHGRWGTLSFTWVLYALGWYFNEALIAGEANSMGLGVLQRLYVELDYTHQYFREARPDAKSSPKTDRLGFFKTHESKLIPRLQWAINPIDMTTGTREPPVLQIRSPQLLDEMRHYERRPRNKTADLLGTHDKDLIMGAEAGYHDDLVSAAAAAVTGWLDLHKFVKPIKTFEAGSLGQVLGHAAVMKPEKRKGPFAMARR